MRNPFKRRKSKSISRPNTHQAAEAGSENFILVTYDSCRYDSYLEAATPVLDARVQVRKAYSQATYTFASHASMFQGMLPHVFAEEEYYNRFVRQMWRIQHRKPVDARLALPQGSKSIIDGFNKSGYFTCGTAAMAWFRNNHYLLEDWQEFEWTGIDARRQIAWTREQIARHSDRPFFAFLNLGETHSPYTFDGKGGGEGDAVAREHRHRSGVAKENAGFDEAMWRMQVACVEFLDARMGELLQFLGETNRDATIVMCGDHGDCFGEDGLYGHGFYHPRVMEVPMGIFDFKAKS